MPEPEAPGRPDLRLAVRVLVWVSATLWLGSAYAWMTGAVDVDGARSQTDAALLLLVLGAAALVAATVVEVERRGRLRPQPEQRDDWADG